jgi:hypothetical protein
MDYHYEGNARRMWGIFVNESLLLLQQQQQDGAQLGMS